MTSLFIISTIFKSNILHLHPSNCGQSKTIVLNGFALNFQPPTSSRISSLSGNLITSPSSPHNWKIFHISSLCKPLKTLPPAILLHFQLRKKKELEENFQYSLRQSWFPPCLWTWSVLLPWLPRGALSPIYCGLCSDFAPITSSCGICALFLFYIIFINTKTW